MKELSIEEKAKRYNEAIKVAENIHKFSSDPAEIKRMEEIFPEFKESEDERIRKEIIKYFKKYQALSLGDYNVQDILAWLEKQGEHAIFFNKIQIGDKVTRNRDGVLVNLSQLNRVAKPAENARMRKAETSSPFFSQTDYRQGVIDGAQWKEQQLEKNRLKHCDELTAEQAQIESDFVIEHLKKNNRTPTFIDAIEYGMKLKKEQMMAKAIDARCFGFQGAALFSFRLPADNYLVGSKVKVIVIKED